MGKSAACAGLVDLLMGLVAAGCAGTAGNKNAKGQRRARGLRKPHGVACTGGAELRIHAPVRAQEISKRHE